MSARQNEDRRVDQVHAMTRQKICKKLNIKSRVGGNFKTFAAKIDMPPEDIALISDEDDPTEAILRWWEPKKGATVKNLRKILEDMERQDILDILDKDPTQGSGQNKRSADQDEDKVDVGRKRRKMRTKPGGQPKSSKIQDINEEVYGELCEDLNYQIQGKDYKALAGKMGYSNKAVRRFSRHSNPAEALLDNWKLKSENDVPRLIQHLEKLGRDDLVELLSQGC